MMNIGKVLKEKRESLGISLPEVADATKISIRVLRAMEEADMDLLPPKTFLRGFVQSYAGYLKMNTDEILAQFQEEMGSARPEESSSNLIRQENQNLPVPPSSRIKLIVAIIFVFAIILVITLVKRTIDKYEKESQITSDFNATLSPPNTSPRQIEHEAFPSDMAPIAHDSPTSPVPDSVSGIQKLDSAVTEANDGTQATPKLQPSPDPAPTASPTPLSAAISPVESSPSPSPTPSPVPSPPTTNAVAKPSSAESKPDAAELTTGAEINGQELIIEALDGLQIEYSIDGGSSKKVKLKPEQLYTIKGRQSILLKVNNGGAINLIHNGADKGVPGDLGRPLEVEFK